MLLSQADSSFFIWLVQRRRLASACVSRCELCRRGVWLHVQTLYDFVFQGSAAEDDKAQKRDDAYDQADDPRQTVASSLPE